MGFRPSQIFAYCAVALLHLLLVDGQSYQLTVDPDYKYRVIWNIDQDNRLIHFDLLVATLGFIGFGVSPDGKMKGADLLTASLGKDGITEIEDLHGVGETEKPVLDSLQDWVVTMVLKNGTHTNLNFFRAFDTGDDKGDVIFQDRVIHIFWAYSLNNSQVFHYHGADVKSDMYKTNLFNPLGSWPEDSNSSLDATSPVPVRKSTKPKKGTNLKKNKHHPKKASRNPTNTEKSTIPEIKEEIAYAEIPTNDLTDTKENEGQQIAKAKAGTANSSALIISILHFLVFFFPGY